MRTLTLFLYMAMGLIGSSCNFTGRANQALAPEDVPQYGPGRYVTDTTAAAVAPEATSAAEIELSSLNYAELRRQLSRADYTWMVVYATWCSHCQQNIGKYPRVADNITERNMQLVLLAQDDDYVAAREMLFKNGVTRLPTFVLDKNTYGADEKERVLSFRKEFCAECDGLPVGTPHHFLFDRNGRLLFQRIGSDIDRGYLLSFMP